MLPLDQGWEKLVDEAARFYREEVKPSLAHYPNEV
jgi:hypothetical protein